MVRWALSPPQRLQLVNNRERENWGAVNGSASPRASFFPLPSLRALSEGSLCRSEERQVGVQKIFDDFVPLFIYSILPYQYRRGNNGIAL